MLARDPGVLADMAGEHRLLGLEHRRDVGAEVGNRPDALAVAAADRVHEVEVWNGLQRLRLAGRIVRHRGGETGVAHQLADRLMVGMVVGRRGRDHHFCLRPADQLGHPPTGRIVVEHAQVRNLAAAVLRADQRRGPRRLGLTDARRLRRRDRGRAEIPAGDGGDADLMSGRGQHGERPGAEGFDVVRVCVDRENGGHDRRAYS